MRTSLEIPVVLPTNGSCDLCINRLKDSLNASSGIEHIEVKPDRSEMLIDYDSNLISLEKIEEEAKETGIALAKKYNHEHFDLAGIDCPDCALTLEKAISRLRGSIWVSVNFASSKMQVEYEADKLDRETIISRIRELGYEVSRVTKPLDERGKLRISTFIVPEMNCDKEIALIRKKLSMKEVEDLSFNLVSQKVTVTHRTSDGEIIKALREINMNPRLEGVEVEEKEQWDRNKKLITTIISGIFAGVGLILHISGYQASTTIPIFLVAIISGGIFVAQKGFYALRSLALDMNFLMTIAVIGAMIIGEWAEGAMVIFLFSLANLLESSSMDRARKAIRSLMKLSPNIATIRVNGQETKISIEEVKIEDVVIIKPGERIPLDGVIIKGESSVNQAPITGESIPTQKNKGDEVYAGTINERGYLEIEVTKLVKDTTLARIIHLVEEAQAQKAPSQSFVDKFAKYYTPIVILSAILIASVPPLIFKQPFTPWLYRALVMLVISCPCALVISTPVSIVSGLTSAARQGILIKGGIYLEDTSSLKAIAFDKTGTLTKGTPEVIDLIPTNSMKPAEILSIAASIESKSEHHLAQAILRKAEEEGLELLEIENFQAITGKGAYSKMNGEDLYIGNHRLFKEKKLCTPQIDAELRELESEGKTAILLGSDREILGIISISDNIRDTSREALPTLKEEGIKTVMLTGDNKGTAKAIAEKLGIDEYYAELLPQDKVDILRELKERYGKVAMVGDGVNDAPAMAMATVGIAMGGAGTDAALQTADIALMADDLSRLPFAINLSRRTLAIIKQNITFSLLIKALFLIMVIPSWVTLWMAVAADMGTSLTVIFNSLRLLRVKDKS